MKKRTDPYIWVTWLTKLLVGDNACEWATWFRAHHEGYEKTPSEFDMTRYKMEHTDLLSKLRGEIEAEDLSVRVEAQNKFTLKGSSGVTLGGMPDLIATSGTSGVICDAKTGKRRESDDAQVMIYMWAVPRALHQYKGARFDGRVAYRDHRVDIPCDAVDEAFAARLKGLIGRVSSDTPSLRIPSPGECLFCDLTQADCPQKISEEETPQGVTDEF